MALRTAPSSHRNTQPFAGFGDPDFSGKSARTRRFDPRVLMRNGQFDVALLRQAAPLPESADELKAQAVALHAPLTSIRTGKAATVSAVKQADLSKTSVITFATHGLVAGELPGLAEPALAFSPPAEPKPEDNGLLTASDIAGLKLNADWIVLSACNTAASDGSEGAEGLSGLARSFFYAGARSLLVSHWPVVSTASARLTVGTFQALAKDQRIGKAEALRQSMLTMIDGAGRSADTRDDAHPIYWAPFVVVGEGNAPQTTAQVPLKATARHR